jgi:hypothetical protein
LQAQRQLQCWPEPSSLRAEPPPKRRPSSEAKSTSTTDPSSAAPSQPVTVTKAGDTDTVKGAAGSVGSPALTEVPFEVVLSCP